MMLLLLLPWPLVALLAPGAAGPAPPLPTPLRLVQVLQLAREHRAEITAARARARAAAQRPALVSALEDPMIMPSLDHIPFGMPGVAWSVQVEQRFPLSSVRGHRRHGAEAEALRLRADSDRVALDVELAAANAFFMLHERRQMTQILEEQRRLATQLVTTSLARYAAGSGQQADVLRAQIEVARTSGALRALRAEVRGAEAMLLASLGAPADGDVPVLDGGFSDEAPPNAAVVRQAALASRPELRAGRAEIDRARAEVAVMDSMYAPMALVRTGPAYTMNEGAGWMVMFGLSLPIWRGRLRAGVAEAEAMVEMAQADLAAMRRMTEGDALAAREQVVAARERLLAVRDEVLPIAKQAIQPTLAGYAAGQLPLVSVIEAASALWSAQNEFVSAEVALGMAWARLYRSTGEQGGRTP